MDLDSIKNIVDVTAKTIDTVNGLRNNSKSKKNSKKEIVTSETISHTYDAQLEKLIELSLLDGELTEKKKQILFKKAESLGIDLDEFEIVLESRLHEHKKLQNESALNKLLRQLQEVENSENEKLENKIIQLLKPQKESNSTAQTVGSALSGVFTVATGGVSDIVTTGAKYLLDNSINEKTKEKIEKWEEDTRTKIIKTRENIISSFFIPAKQEDIVEFVDYAWQKINKLSSDPNKKIWESKFEEIVNSSKRKYSNDSEFLAKIAEIEVKRFAEMEEYNSKEKTKKKTIMGFIAVVVVIVGILIPTTIIPIFRVESKAKEQEQSRLEQVLQNIHTAIQNQKLENAEILVNQLVWKHESSWSNYVEEKKIWEKEKTEISKTIDKVKKEQEQSRLEQVLQNLHTAIKNQNWIEADVLLNQLVWKHTSSWDNYKNEKKYGKKKNRIFLK